MADAKLVNTEAYDHLASWYLSWVSAQTSSPRERYAAKVLKKYNDNTNNNDDDDDDKNTSSQQDQQPYILELGCGPGIPTTHQLLSSNARVLANDISPAQIATAKTHIHNHSHSSDVSFEAGDMTALSIPEATFDGVVCFFTLFHLPRAEQPPMLSKIYSWLKVGGLLVCNFATFDEEEIYGEMMGHGIFWSGFGVSENRAMVLEAGFEVEMEEVLESEVDGGNEFWWVAARKTRG